jgi:hypothetical protein
MRTAIICGAFVLAMATASAAPGQYLCITESAAGLRYDAEAQSWKPQAFAADGKYVLRRITDDDQKKYGILLKYAGSRGAPVTEADWAFFTFGENPRPLATCNESLASEFACQRVVEVPLSDIDISFHRFEMVHRGGYIEQGYQEQIRQDPDKIKQQPPALVSDPSHSDDLVIEVGKCSPF